jgi:hypothetical protein
VDARRCPASAGHHQPGRHADRPGRRPGGAGDRHPLRRLVGERRPPRRRPRRDEAGVVPELNVRLAYQVTPRLAACVGYTFLYWSDVVRAGDQIDQTVNATLIPPPAAPSGPARPAFGFRSTDFWAQGLDLGLELHY